MRPLKICLKPSSPVLEARSLLLPELFESASLGVYFLKKKQQLLVILSFIFMFKVCNSMVCSMYTKWCAHHHHLIPQHFRHPLGVFCPSGLGGVGTFKGQAASLQGAACSSLVSSPSFHTRLALELTIEETVLLPRS